MPAAHAWLRPRLEALMAEAEAAGIARDVSMAVITDLVNGPLAAPVPLPGEANPNQDIGEPDSAASPESGAHPSQPEEPAEGGRLQDPIGSWGNASGGVGYGGV